MADDRAALLVRYQALAERMKATRPRLEALRHAGGWVNVVAALPLVERASVVLQQLEASARTLQRLGPSMPGAAALLGAAEAVVPVLEDILSQLEQWAALRKGDGS